MAPDPRDPAAVAGERFKCPKGACDQKKPCAFYCWWQPTMKALNYEANQYGPTRA